MSKHTNGPWICRAAEKSNFFYIESKSGDVAYLSGALQPDSVEDNAKLIANAPELHEAVAAVISATQDYLPPGGITKDEFITRVIAATDNARMAEIMK